MVENNFNHHYHISLQNVGKSYNRKYVFKGIDFEIPPKTRLAILGKNGSGKSTLLQSVLGIQTVSKGEIIHSLQGKKLDLEESWKYINFCSPSLELPEELNVQELLAFHSKFKKPLLKVPEILRLLELEKDSKKEIFKFSSGMKQRVKLGLSLVFDSKVVLLDEPCSHLDQYFRNWYISLINQFIGDRTLIIGSNDSQEYTMCNTFLEIGNYTSFGSNKE